MKRKWDISDERTRKKCVEEVLTRIQEQEGAEFGIIAAEELINIIAQNIGPDIYNLAIRDAKKLLESKLSDLDSDLDMLELTA